MGAAVAELAGGVAAGGVWAREYVQGIRARASRTRTTAELFIFISFVSGPA
jgi:hypothetical protein